MTTTRALKFTTITAALLLAGAASADAQSYGEKYPGLGRAQPATSPSTPAAKPVRGNDVAVLGEGNGIQSMRAIAPRTSGVDRATVRQQAWSATRDESLSGETGEAIF
ncbi:hypothetical protein [Xylophilus sp. GOD-11R]|uniref:hypothetical protein n=1 Tax=Xylophilus sp. GOD-11R TaxID=3089814 RepID=UPI00298BCD86|nr:hypothetical protein [Xylophilus sp. GOD-11R]WPB55864.1 hypothetical protein R9X41_17170 [Xylophilus sp. GOD-11R]